MSLNKNSGRTALAVCLTVAAGMASAQVLEEVTVTAQKREESAQDVGIAISAFNGDQIQKLGFTESTDISVLSPGVNIAVSSAGQTRSFSIRGVTQNDFSDHTEAPNAVYIDEGYIAAPQGQVFGVFDLERIEVLKGPQGTLFGRNATGGLVHYITKKPTHDFEAYGDVAYGRYNSVRAEGAVNGELAANVAGRLSVFFNRFDDIMDNNYPDQQPIDGFTGQPNPGTLDSRGGPDDFWNDEQYAIRGQLLFDINDRVQWLASAFYSSQDASTGPYQSRGTIPVLNAQGGHVNTIYANKTTRNCEAISAETGACIGIGGSAQSPVPLDNDLDTTRPRVGGDLFGYVDRDGKGFDTSVDFALDDFNNYEVYGTTHKLTWDLDWSQMTAIANYMHFWKEQALDVDAAPVNQSLVDNNSKHDEFTAELRFSGELERARWVAGFYYLWIDVHREQSLPFPAGSTINTLLAGPPFFAPTFGIGWEAPAINDLETNSYSLFGQLDIDLTDQLTFIAGLRTIWEYKDSHYENPVFLDIDPAVIDDGQPEFTALSFFSYPSFDDKHHKTMWTGKLQLNWSPTDDLLLYGGINRGVKGFGYNGKLNDLTAPVPPDLQRYKEEILLAYEAGLKSTLFGGTTRFNANFYYYDYKDYQAFVFVQSAGVITNADATYKGIELDLQSSPIDNLDFSFVASFIDPEVHHLNVAPGVPRDVKPSFTPTVTMGSLARYTWPGVMMGGDIALQLDGNYVSSRYHNLRNFQGQKMEAYALGNARLTWYAPAGDWEVQGYITNFTDEHYLTTGFDLSTLCGCNEESYGMPRMFGIRLRYNYGG